MNGRRIGKRQKLSHASFLSCLEEPLLTGLFGPIITAIRGQKAFSAPPDIFDIGVIALFRRAGAEVKSPEGKADSLRIAICVRLTAKEQVSDTLPLL